MILQDKTGTIDAKIWDPNSMGIREFEALDYVDIMGDVSSFNGALQVSIKNARKAEEANIIRRTICRRAVTTSIRCIRS